MVGSTAPPEGGRLRLLNPLTIRFSQPRIAPHFRDGHMLEETAEVIREAPLEKKPATEIDPRESMSGTPPYDCVLIPPFPLIRVISWRPKIRRADGMKQRDAQNNIIMGERAWFAIDNRRLHAAQAAAAKRWPRHCCVIVECIDEMPGEDAKELRKFRTTTEGKSISIGIKPTDSRDWSWAEEIPTEAAQKHPPSASSPNLVPEAPEVEELFDAFAWAPEAAAVAKAATAKATVAESVASGDASPTEAAAEAIAGVSRPPVPEELLPPYPGMPGAPPTPPDPYSMFGASDLLGKSILDLVKKAGTAPPDPALPPPSAGALNGLPYLGYSDFELAALTQAYATGGLGGYPGYPGYNPFNLPPYPFAGVPPLPMKNPYAMPPRSAMPTPAMPPKPGKMKTACPSDGWQYIDPNGKIQGPFRLEQMVNWSQLGYFKPHLQMRCDPEDRFVPYAELWPTGVKPFTHLVLRPGA